MLIAIAIAASAVLLTVLAFVSLSGVPTPPPFPQVRAPAFAARVWCPLSGAAADVRIGVVPGTGGPRFGVVQCERLPGGTVTCDRLCFSALSLVATA